MELINNNILEFTQSSDIKTGAVDYGWECPECNGERTRDKDDFKHDNECRHYIPLDK